MRFTDLEAGLVDWDGDGIPEPPYLCNVCRNTIVHIHINEFGAYTTVEYDNNGQQIPTYPDAQVLTLP